ncbi:MAG: GntR family transcriptional regulator [Victivallales bacterium]
MIVKNVPYYIQVADVLRKELKAGQYLAYSEFPDELALAARFSVSKDVIRQSRKILSDEGLLKPVQGKGTYVMEPKPAAYGNSVHLNIFQSTVHAIPILRAVQDFALDNNLLFSVHVTDAFSLERERIIIRKACDNNCGILVSSPSLTYEDKDNGDLYKEMIGRGVSLVLIDRYVGGTGADLVYFDNRTTAYNMMKDLGDCNPKSIFILHTQGYRISDERRNGFLAGQKEFFPSMPANNFYFPKKWHDKTEEETAADAVRYMKKNRIFPEVLISCQPFAWNVFNQLRKENLHKSIKKIISFADCCYGDVEFNSMHLGYYRIFDEFAKELNQVLKVRIEKGRNSSPLIVPLICRPLAAKEAEEHSYESLISS